MSEPAIPTISVDDAAERCRETGAGAPVLVDVREPDEYGTVRAEGAVLLPLSTFAERYRELPTDRPIYVICQTGRRSAAATAHLLRNGFGDVTNVEGGTTAWEKAGLPIRRGEPDPGEGSIPG